MTEIADIPKVTASSSDIYAYSGIESVPNWQRYFYKNYSPASIMIFPQKKITTNNLLKIRTQRELVEELLARYSVSDRAQVFGYIYDNFELLTPLYNIFSELEEMFSSAVCGLRYYKDSEEGWERLFLMVRTSDSKVDCNALEDTVLERWYMPNKEVLTGKIVLSVENDGV